MAHRDANGLDRLGKHRVQEHFGITNQCWRNWRRDGVPVMHRKTLLLLGAIHGVALPEFEA